MRKKILNVLVTSLALIFLLLGLILLFTPIPIGAALIAISLTILIYTNASTQKIITALRAEYEIIHKKIEWLEDKVENRFEFVHKALKKTHPSKKNEKH